ncbi:hypothetical protein ACHAXS_008718, partial [Conticribra weissflogii]
MNRAKASMETTNNNEQPTQPQQQRQQRQQRQQQPSDLTSFSLAAAIDEARFQPRRIFNALSPFAHRRQPSQQSIATNTSFATAQESIVNESTATPAASSIADSSSDEDDTNQEELTFGNDPIAVISQSSYNSSRAPSEIIFSNANDYDIHPEETTFSSSPSNANVTMAKKSSTNSTAKKSATPETLPVAASITADTTTTMTAPIPETKPTAIETLPPKPSPSPPTSPPEELQEEAHFDLAQQVYGATKNIWSWGKTVPVLSNLLGLTEHVAAGILDKTVKMKLETVDSDVAVPKLKELDDRVVTPVILAVWRIVGPVVGKGEEMVVKP